MTKTFEEALAEGRDNTIELLLTMASNDAKGLSRAEDTQRERIIKDLRRLADVLETNPSAVKGLAIFTNEVIDDGKQVQNQVDIVGPSEFIAAVHLRLEPFANNALQQVMPKLISRALKEMVMAGSLDEGRFAEFSDGVQFDEESPTNPTKH